MTPHPKVTALMPAWQSAPFVAEGLDSLLAQTWPDLDILVSVDLSTDGTAEICCGYAERHSNVRVVVQTERLGWIGNTNFLLNNAEGDYLLFAAHDDLLAPRYVETLMTVLEARPDAALAFSDMLTTRDSGENISRYPYLDDLASAESRAREFLRARGEWWTPYRGVFRAAAGREIGGLKRHRAGEYAADWPWLLALALRGPFVRTPEVLCFKRYQAGSLSFKWRHSLFDWFAVSGVCGREIQASVLSRAAKLRLTAWLWTLRATWVALKILQRLGLARRLA